MGTFFAHFIDTGGRCEECVKSTGIETTPPAAALNEVMSLRIESGELKGRKLLAPPGSAPTRPITGFVRKSVFGIVQDWLPEAVVVDLYAGTGTVGLEAVSRGASVCCFAERDRRVIDRLKRNIAECGVEDRCVVWAGTIEASLPGWLRALGREVDLAFVDPPFPAARTWDWHRVARQIFDPLAGALADDGLMVLRVPLKVEVPDTLARLECKRTREYGGMKVLFFGLPAESGE